MNMHADKFISNILKNWVASHKPPVNGRAELFAKATTLKRNRYDLCALIPRFQFFDYPIQNINDCTQTLGSCFFAQSIHASVQTRVKSYAL
jgi:hypothetical protein